MSEKDSQDAEMFERTLLRIMKPLTGWQWIKTFLVSIGLMIVLNWPTVAAMIVISALLFLRFGQFTSLGVYYFIGVILSISLGNRPYRLSVESKERIARIRESTRYLVPLTLPITIAASFYGLNQHSAFLAGLFGLSTIMILYLALIVFLVAGNRLRSAKYAFYSIPYVMILGPMYLMVSLLGQSPQVELTADIALLLLLFAIPLFYLVALQAILFQSAQPHVDLIVKYEEQVSRLPFFDAVRARLGLARAKAYQEKFEWFQVVADSRLFFVGAYTNRGNTSIKIVDFSGNQPNEPDLKLVLSVVLFRNLAIELRRYRPRILPPIRAAVIQRNLVEGWFKDVAKAEAKEDLRRLNLDGIGAVNFRLECSKLVDESRSALLKLVQYPIDELVGRLVTNIDRLANLKKEELELWRNYNQDYNASVPKHISLRTAEGLVSMNGTTSDAALAKLSSDLEEYLRLSSSLPKYVESGVSKLLAQQK